MKYQLSNPIGWDGKRRCQGHPWNHQPQLRPVKGNGPVQKVQRAYKCCPECAWRLLGFNPELREQFGNPYDFEPQEPEKK